MMNATMMKEMNRKAKAVNSLLNCRKAPFQVELKDVYKQNRGEIPAFELKPLLTNNQISPIVYWEPKIDMMSDLDFADYLLDIFIQNTQIICSGELPDISATGILDNVLPRVISDENIDELETHGIPYTRLKGFTDLVATYYVPVDSMHGLISITDTIVKNACLTKADLHSASVNNINNQVVIKTMLQALLGLDEDVPFIEPSDSMPLWVVTTPSATFGAGAIAGGQQMFRTIANTIGATDFFVLPSSIHEVLVLPDTGDNIANFQNLLEMVTEINASVVSPEDRLTDNVYHYYGKTEHVVHCK